MRIRIYYDTHPSKEPITVYNVKDTEIENGVLTVSFKNNTPDWSYNWGMIFCIEREFDDGKQG